MNELWLEPELIELGTALYLQSHQCQEDEPELVQLPMFSPPEGGCFSQSVRDWNSRETTRSEPQMVRRTSLLCLWLDIFMSCSLFIFMIILLYVLLRVVIITGIEPKVQRKPNQPHSPSKNDSYAGIPNI